MLKQKSDCKPIALNMRFLEVRQYGEGYISFWPKINNGTALPWKVEQSVAHQSPKGLVNLFYQTSGENTRRKYKNVY